MPSIRSEKVQFSAGEMLKGVMHAACVFMVSHVEKHQFPVKNLKLNTRGSFRALISYALIACNII